MFSTVTNLPSARIGFFCGFLLILTGCNAGGCNGGGEDPSNGNTSRLGKFSHDDDVVMKMALFDFRAPVDGVGNDVAISKVGGEVTFTSPDGTSWVAPVDTHTDWASVPVALHGLTGRPDDRKLARPALIHDAFCQQYMHDGKPVKTACYRTRTWEATHQMFYDACLASGASEAEARRWWAGVRIGGPKWDVNGNTIHNSLGRVALEALYAILYGPDQQRRQEPPSLPEMNRKIQTFEKKAQFAEQSSREAKEFASRGEIEECGKVVATCVQDLNLAADVDKGGTDPVFYAALKGEFLVDVASELNRRGHPDVALAKYGEAERELEFVLKHQPLEAANSIRLTKLQGQRQGALAKQRMEASPAVPASADK